MGRQQRPRDVVPQQNLNHQRHALCNISCGLIAGLLHHYSPTVSFVQRLVFRVLLFFVQRVFQSGLREITYDVRSTFYVFLFHWSQLCINLFGLATKAPSIE